ncbi:MAG: hypothetical protein L3K01_05420 [Thermoplasmata archaeon]|nr:hypothetical protein [Thermoplasmata archaeon]
MKASPFQGPTVTPRLRRPGLLPHAGLATTAGVLLAGILLTMPLSMAGAPISTSVTAPYPAVMFFRASHNADFAAGCAYAKSGVAPHWSNRTGNGSLTATAGAATCPGARQPNVTRGDSNSQPWFRVVAPLALSANVTSVQATWTISLFASDTLYSNGSCPLPVLDSSGGGYDDCAADANWYMGVGGLLVDKTTHVVTRSNWHVLASRYGASTATSDTTCYQFNCSSSNGSSGSRGTQSWSGTWTVTLYMNGTFVAGQKYDLWLNVSAGAFAYFSNHFSPLGLTGPSPVVFAVAHADVGRKGNHVDLDSIRLL